MERGAFLQALCFFDVRERRWYSIAADDSNPYGEFLREWFFTVFSGMEDGLISELMKSPEGIQIHFLVLTDPVAETKRETLVPPMPCHFSSRPTFHFPVVVTAWHRVAGSLQTNNFSSTMDSIRMRHKCMYMNHPPCEWRDLGIPSEELGVRKAVSAVIFRESLYIVFHSHTLCRESHSPSCVLVSYNLEKNKWREVPTISSHSDGICGSVLWVTEASGEVAVYDVASGSAGLPPQPLGKIHGINNPQNDMYLSYKYSWK